MHQSIVEDTQQASTKTMKLIFLCLPSEPRLPWNASTNLLVLAVVCKIPRHREHGSAWGLNRQPGIGVFFSGSLDCAWLSVVCAKHAAQGKAEQRHSGTAAQRPSRTVTQRHSGTAVRHLGLCVVCAKYATPYGPTAAAAAAAAAAKRGIVAGES